MFVLVVGLQQSPAAFFAAAQRSAMRPDIVPVLVLACCCCVTCHVQGGNPLATRTPNFIVAQRPGGSTCLETLHEEGREAPEAGCRGSCRS